MPTTRSKTEAFKHIVNNVFQVPNDGPLYKALEKSGDNDVMAMISLRDCDIDTLTFDRSDTEKNVPLSRGDKNLLRIFCHYVLYCDSIGHPIGHDWLSLTSDDFDDYQISSHCLAIVSGSVPPPPALTTTTTASTQSTRPVLTPVDTFKHGIKRDPALFMVFKDGKQFDSWQYSTMALA